MEEKIWQKWGCQCPKCSAIKEKEWKEALALWKSGQHNIVLKEVHFDDFEGDRTELYINGFLVDLDISWEGQEGLTDLLDFLDIPYNIEREYEDY